MKVLHSGVTQCEEGTAFRKEPEMPALPANLDDEALQIKTSVKADESRRQVPIHPELIQAGFLAYVAHCKALGHDWLFLHLKPDRCGKRGGNWSKWLARWRKVLGVEGSRRHPVI